MAKLTLKDKKVEEFLVFQSTPKYKRPENEKTLAEYAKNHSISPQALCQNYLTIAGFKEEVWKRKKDLFIRVAESGLLQRAEGVKIEEERSGGKDGNIYTVKELAPDASACEVLLKYSGVLTEKMEVSGSIDANLVMETIKKHKRINIWGKTPLRKSAISNLYGY